LPRTFPFILTHVDDPPPRVPPKLPGKR
jgi:hypothetical protein